ncbi:unnamed protein product, partial [Brassica rapa subsp. narinosa]
MMTLVSLLALAKSISLLWPHGDNYESSKHSRFYRDCAVSATTFYAVMLLRSSSLQGVHYRYTEVSSV